MIRLSALIEPSPQFKDPFERARMRALSAVILCYLVFCCALVWLFYFYPELGGPDSQSNFIVLSATLPLQVASFVLSRIRRPGMAVAMWSGTQILALALAIPAARSIPQLTSFLNYSLVVVLICQLVLPFRSLVGVSLLIIAVDLVTVFYRQETLGTQPRPVYFAILFVSLCTILILIASRYREEAEGLAQAKHRELAASSRLSTLGTLAAGVAHEINNPLAVIHGYASQIIGQIDRDGAPPKELRVKMERIQQHSLRIADIVRSLRVVSRNASEDPHEFRTVNELIADTIALCAQRFKQAGVELKIRVEVISLVRCHAGEICQVLINLLQNALDAVSGQPNGKVELSCRRTEMGLEFRVSDNGPGIPPQIQSRIFDPFFTTKEPGKGTGLGLSIAQGIIQAHDGRLYIDADAPTTTFVVFLPANRLSLGEARTQELVH